MKKSKKKNTKKNQRHYLIKNKLAILLFLVFIILSVVIVSRIYSSSSNPLIEDRSYINQLPQHAIDELERSTPSATFRVPVLMYHYVEYVKDPGDTIRKSLDIVPYVFENQVKTLRDAGYSFITPSDLGDVLDGKMSLPEKPIILSFDDGYMDFYTDVLPILKKYDARAVVYVISGFLDKPNFMNSWQVKDIASQSSSLVEIGAHTVHHAYLKGLPEDKSKYEIDESKRMLENLTNAPVVSFAYPYGAFDAQAERLVREAGFKTAVTTVPGVEENQQDRFFIFRIRPGGRMGEDLLNYLGQSYFKAY